MEQGLAALVYAADAALVEIRAALWALEWARGPVGIITYNEAVLKDMYQILFLDVTPLKRMRTYGNGCQVQ